MAVTPERIRMKQVQGKPLPLGVSVEKDRVNFSVATEGGKECKLLLYSSGKSHPCESYAMTQTVGEVHYLAFEDMDVSAYEYNYEIDGKVILDSYVKAIAGKTKWGEKKSLAGHEIRGKIEVPEYDWEEDSHPNLSGEEVVAYSLHVRGFTKDSSLNVQIRGTFEGIIEKIPYLKELGVNQLHLMPVYEFDECDEQCNYWGYGMAYFFAPKNGYSAVGDGVKSLKDMVKACHRERIEVVLEMPFDAQVPKQYMEECLRYYLMEYHVDGFILNPSVTPMDVAVSDPILKRTKILHHRTDFQNVMRKFLKGDGGMVSDVIYWLRHSSSEEGIFNYITNQNGFTLQDLVSYNEKHNEDNGEDNKDGSDYNLSWNCGIEGPSRKKAVIKLRKRQVRNAFILTLLAQGIPCILAGDEFGNTQKGNNNVYCQDNTIGWVNWKGLEKEEELHEFVKKLIQIRKNHKVFCPAQPMKGTDKTGCGIPDVSYHGEEAWRMPTEHLSRQLGVYYHDESGEDCFVAYNMHWLEQTFALPVLPKDKSWHLLISTDENEEGQECLKEQKTIELAPRTIAVFVGRTENEA